MNGYVPRIVLNLIVSISFQTLSVPMDAFLSSEKMGKVYTCIEIFKTHLRRTSLYLVFCSQKNNKPILPIDQITYNSKDKKSIIFLHK